MPDSPKPPDVIVVVGVVILLLVLGILFAVLGLTPLIVPGYR